MNVRHHSFDRKLRTDSLYLAKEQVGGNACRQVEHHCHARCAWRDALEDLQPLSANARLKIAEASSVTAGVRKTWHETIEDGFGHRHKHDWNCVSRLLDRR